MTTKITITEAFAEKKMLPKRIQKQRDFIIQYLARAAAMRDPFSPQGKNAPDEIKQALQSIKDMEDRIIHIKAAIHDANSKNTITHPKMGTMTITDWLTFRHEILDGRTSFLSTLTNKVAQLRQAAAQKGAVATNDPKAANGEMDIVIHLDETWLHDEIDRVAELTGWLDGQLSLLNARIEIEI